MHYLPRVACKVSRQMHNQHTKYNLLKEPRENNAKSEKTNTTPFSASSVQGVVISSCVGVVYNNKKKKKHYESNMQSGGNNKGNHWIFHNSIKLTYTFCLFLYPCGNRCHYYLTAFRAGFLACRKQ